MANVSADDLQTLSRALAALYAHADLSEFPYRVLDAARVLVANDHAAYNEIGPGACIGVSDPQDALHDTLVPVFHEFNHQHPRLARYPGEDDGRALALSDYWSCAEMHRTDLFQLVYKPMEVADQLSIIAAGPEPFVSLAFNRSRRGFTDHERALLDLFRPHFAQALASAAAVSRLREQEAGLTRGVRQAFVRLRGSGAVRYLGEHARVLLDDYFPPRRHRRLPERLTRWIEEQRRGFSPETRTAMTIARGRARLDLRLVPDPVAEGWLLLLEEREEPARTAVTALPPRLRQVLDLLLEGLSEKEVAGRLELTTSTVHGYVKRIYRHFDVSSRAELMALWVRRDARPRGD